MRPRKPNKSSERQKITVRFGNDFGESEWFCVEAMTSEEIISASILYAEETGG
jgi:hypothetical protein